MPDLRECPFCGSGDISMVRYAGFYAECNGCGCAGPDSEISDPLTQQAVREAAAIDAWNRRAGEDGSDG